SGRDDGEAPRRRPPRKRRRGLRVGRGGRRLQERRHARGSAQGVRQGDRALREAGEVAPWARGAADASTGRPPSRIPSTPERRRPMKKFALALLLAALPLAAQRGP